MLAKQILVILLGIAEQLMGLFSPRNPAEREVREALQAGIELAQNASEGEFSPEQVAKCLKEFNDATLGLLRLLPSSQEAMDYIAEADSELQKILAEYGR